MQVFIAVGRCSDHDATYVYAFADPDEAMAFVEMAQQHDDDAVSDWTIVTQNDVNVSSEEAYEEHRNFVTE